MTAPAVDVALAQRKLDAVRWRTTARGGRAEYTSGAPRRACLWSWRDYRIFYDDVLGAIAWLRQAA